MVTETGKAQTLFFTSWGIVEIASMCCLILPATDRGISLAFGGTGFGKHEETW